MLYRVTLGRIVFLMEYIVHGSKNQNDSKLKLTLVRFELKRCKVSICHNRSWSRMSLT